MMLSDGTRVLCTGFVLLLLATALPAQQPARTSSVPTPVSAHQPSHMLSAPVAVSAVSSDREAFRDSGTLPDNVILLIGDGMGAAQLSLLRLMDPEGLLDTFPVAGFSQTASADRLVTESAAAATALSSGVRTANGMLGQSPDGTPLRSLLEHARSRGKATGVIATSAVTHATPAAFMAHVPSRSMQNEIAVQIASSGTEVIMGGGRKFFLPANDGGSRGDGRDLTAEMTDRGYRVVMPDAHTDAIRVPADLMPGGKLLLLAADDGLPSAADRRISLRDMTQHALALLSAHGEGFVLVIEGSQIDWACHDNDFSGLRDELKDFRDAVAEALSFARANRRTAVIVTADHETGGLALVGEKPDASDISGEWISEDHTASMVPVLAAGPGSTRFGGIHRNDEIGRLLHSLLGVE